MLHIKDNTVETVLFILAKSVQLLLGLVSIAMLIRAIMPFFFEVEDNKLFILACFISEPLIAPVRLVMVKLNIGQNSPIDWAFFVTYLIIGILESILPVI